MSEGALDFTHRVRNQLLFSSSLEIDKEVITAV